MERVITISGIEVNMESSGDIPRMYRNKFGKDVIVQMSACEARARKNKGATMLEADDVEMFENLAWCMAKHADSDVPDIDEWLRQFSATGIIEAAPALVDMWVEENKSTSTLKKRDGQSIEK